MLDVRSVSVAFGGLRALRSVVADRSRPRGRPAPRDRRPRREGIRPREHALTRRDEAPRAGHRALDTTDAPAPRRAGLGALAEGTRRGDPLLCAAPRTRADHLRHRALAG